MMATDYFTLLLLGNPYMHFLMADKFHSAHHGNDVTQISDAPDSKND